MRTLEIFVAVAVTGLLGAGCPAKDEHGHEHDLPSEAHDHGKEESHAQQDEHGHLPQATADELDLKLAEVWTEPHYPTRKIPGSVRVDPDRRVSLSAPLTARIVSLDAPPHSSVEAGQRLVVLEIVDPEVRQLQIRAVTARAELLQVRTDLSRTRAYLKALRAREGSPGAELRRVKADLHVLEVKDRAGDSALSAILASLRSSGLSITQLKALEQEGQVVTRISLRAPSLAGKPVMEVATRPVHLGQTVSAGDELYELVALDRLQVMGEAFEADVASVRAAARDGLPVQLLFPAENRRVQGLSILSVEGSLDSEERLIHFFVPLSNEILSRKQVDGNLYLDWKHRAGSRVQILVATGEPAQRFILPVGALVRDAGQSWVFRVHEGGLDRVAVRVVSADERRVVIAPGGSLSEGELLVFDGALRVHLAMEQASLSSAEKSSVGDHGHAH